MKNETQVKRQIRELKAIHLEVQNKGKMLGSEELERLEQRIDELEWVLQ